MNRPPTLEMPTTVSMNTTVSSLGTSGLHTAATDRATQDSIRTARGFALGIAVSLPVWALLGWLVWSVA